MTLLTDLRRRRAVSSCITSAKFGYTLVLRLACTSVEECMAIPKITDCILFWAVSTRNLSLYPCESIGACQIPPQATAFPPTSSIVCIKGSIPSIFVRESAWLLSIVAGLQSFDSQGEKEDFRQRSVRYRATFAFRWPQNSEPPLFVCNICLRRIFWHRHITSTYAARIVSSCKTEKRCRLLAFLSLLRSPTIRAGF